MKERHLHEATAADVIGATADRVAADLIERVGQPIASQPDYYEQLQHLVSLAYLRGASDELKRRSTSGGAA